MTVPTGSKKDDEAYVKQLREVGVTSDLEDKGKCNLSGVEKAGASRKICLTMDV